MLLIPLLSLLAQQPALQSSEVEVRPEGAFYTNQTSDGLFHTPTTQNQALVSGPRWQVDDLGLAWIGEGASVGDSGASAMASLQLNNESVSVWATGSNTPIFDYSTFGAFAMKVDIADRNNTAAALVSNDLGGSNFQSTLSVWDSAGNGTPDWSATLPTTGNVYSSMVGVNDKGSKIVAAASNSSGVINIRVFDRAGGLLNSWDLPTSANLRYGAIDDNADRLYVAYYNGDAELYDLDTGTTLAVFSIGATFDAHALSGDGKTVAYGSFSGLTVMQETSPGVWTQVAYRSNPSSSYLARAALNTDGSRAAFEIQRYSPAYDHIEAGMLDVGTGLDLNHQSMDAPGSGYQLNCSGVDISDAGDVMVAASWGDEFNVTPEVFTMDDQGNLLSSIDLAGSAMSVDLGPDGDVAFAGSKAVHANTFGNGGSMTCFDADDQNLHMLGYPQLGGSLTVESPDGAAALTFSVCAALGSTPTPFGISELDLATEITRNGPNTIPTGGLSMPLSIPTRASFAGMLVHVQGVRFGVATELTNKVSIRLLP
jgi:hypothetical protein